MKKKRKSPTPSVAEDPQALRRRVAELKAELEQLRSAQGASRARADEWKQTAALRESEQRYRTLVENLNVGVYRSTAAGKGRFLEANPALAAMHGYELDEFRRMPLESLYATRNDRKALLTELTAAGSVRDRPLLLRRKDGSTFWVSITATIQRDEQGQIEWIDGIVEDVTERREAREALERQARFLQELIDAIPTPMFYKDREGVYRMCNQAYEEFFGRTRDEIVGKTAYDLIPRDVGDTGRMAKHERMDKALFGSSGTQTYESAVPRADSALRDMLISKAVIHGPDGEIAGLVGALLDITERKRTEREAHEQKRKYQDLVEALRDVIYEVDAEGRITYLSPACETLFGYAPSELVGESMLPKVLPEDAPGVTAAFEKAIAGESLPHHECRVRAKSGQVRWVRASARPVETDGRFAGIRGVITDITEQVEAREALRASEARMRAVMLSLHDTAISVVDETGKVLDAWAAESLERKTGLGPAQTVGRNLADLYPKETASARLAAVRRAIHKAEPSRQTFCVALPDGELWLEASMYPMRDADGKITAAVSFVQDVTERERSAKALRESEARFRSVLEASRDLIYKLDLRTLRYDYVSPSARRLTGYSVEEATAMGPLAWQQRLHPEDRDAMIEHFEKLRQGDEREAAFPITEYRWRCKEGEYRWFSDHRFLLRDEKGVPVAVVGAIRDATDRKRAERDLRDSHERLQQILDNTWDIIFQIDLEGNYTFGNRAAERVTGYPLDELMRMNMRQLVAPEGVESVFDRLRRRVAGETLPQPHVFDILRKDEARVTLELTTTGIMHEGTLVGVQGIARDITERRRAEEEVHRSELLYRTTIDAMDEFVNVVDKDLSIRLCNRAYARWCRELGLGEPTAGRPLLEVHPFLPDHVAQEYRHVLGAGKPVLTEETTVLGGREIITETRKMPIVEGGRVVRVVTIMRDITERRHAERALRAARAKLVQAREQERWRLAAELHDSVGQSLIALQLHIQSCITADFDRMSAEGVRQCAQDVAATCADLVREVRSICHGLYPATLESLGLVAALEQLARGVPEGSGIACEFTSSEGLDRQRLPAEVEIALFRIAQEALSNAVRHGGATRIELHLGRIREQAVLTVTDDGSGFVQEASAIAGFGLTSMRERASAVGGELNIESGPDGTCVEATVPVAG